MHTASKPTVLADPRTSRLDAETLLASARDLQRAGESAAMAALLRGRNLGLVCEKDDSEQAHLFRHAAAALGARVTHIRPSVSELDGAGEEGLRLTARILGRLYDALECQGLSPALVRRLERDAGVPVFDALASPGHPTAPLADMLAGVESIETKRLLIIEAALLFSLLNRNPTGGSVPRKGIP
jgi:ornithine carbamoyltransferase